MNTAARTVNQNIITPKRLVAKLADRSQLLFVALFATVVLSALSVIYVTNESRLLNTSLQQAQNQQTQLNTQWGQLLLEKSSWKSQTYVANIAKTQLNMVLPNNRHYVLVSS